MARLNETVVALGSAALNRRLIYSGAAIVFGVWSLILGQDANWDLRNYHWYNPYAFLTGRAAQDIAPAGMQTFFNPLLDIPWFILGTNLPGPAAGFLIGLVHTVDFILLFEIAATALGSALSGRRKTVALGLAVAGICGAGSLSELGTTFNDAATSAGVLGSLLLLLRCRHVLRDSALLRCATVALLTGVPVGMATGVKMTAALFGAGLAAACLALPAPLGRRAMVLLSFSIGFAVAFAAAGGPWMWHVWQETGNPLFPLYNRLIGSTVSGHYAIRTAPSPLSLHEVLALPWLAALHPTRLAEVPFRDWRIACAFTVIPPALVAAALGKGRQPNDNGAFIMLLVGSLSSFLIWSILFPYYRYIIALEMLAPLLIWLALARLPVPSPVSTGISVVLILALVATTRPADWGRVPWGSHFVEVAAPPLANPASTLILLANQPTGFVIPSFPRAVSFVTLDAQLAPPADLTLAWNRRLHDRIEKHSGDMFVIWSPEYEADVPIRLARVGLATSPQECQPLQTNLAVGPGERLTFCPLHRAR